MAWDYYMGSLRWFHVIAGITWIGILYYFNFIQTPSFKKMDAAARSNAIINLVPLALWWFRYAALATFLAGTAWMLSRGVQITWDLYTDTSSFKSILVGATIGTIMFLNVWVIIWPNQKKIIAATRATVEEGTPAPPDQPKWARTALLASRTNTLLSIPMLFFMISSAHLGRLWD
ncbi:MAG: urate hydroxylase PuuD [Dehalococcoidia bacterium]